MKKLLLFLMWFLFALALNVGHAEAVPGIRGEYSGTYSTVVSNCTDSSSNGTYNAVLAMRISTQNGNTFSGTATGTFEPNAIEYIQLSGTISESGQISGNTSHTFLATGGEGTFTGQLSGNTLSIENPGHDTYGNTCTYIRDMSATRKGSFPPNESKILPLDELSNQYFGISVSISGGYAIVGASEGHDNNGVMSGSAYIFERSGSNWSQVAKLTANDGEYNDAFGYSVSISGDYAIVGAYGDGGGYGSAYIFKRSGSNWSQVAKLTANDWGIGDSFGNSVSISGGYAIVGVMYDDDNGWNAGSAYIFGEYKSVFK